MVDYPVLVTHNDVTDPLPMDVENELQWKAIFQLPKRARNSARSLAKTGKYLDKIDNVIRTNAFTQLKGGVLLDL
jgi:hypothetical protein